MIEFYLECSPLLKYACALALKSCQKHQGKFLELVLSVILVIQNQLIATNSKKEEKKGFHFQSMTQFQNYEKKAQESNPITEFAFQGQLTLKDLM